MPRVVSEVPDLWKPYMDGQIWEFTEEEMRAMPNGAPMMSTYDGAPVGPRKVTWYLGHKYYVTFFDPETDGNRSMAQLAGWEK